MKTLKVMSIIGWIVAGVFIMYAASVDVCEDLDVAIGCTVLTGGYLIALSVVAFVQANKALKG